VRAASRSFVSGLHIIGLVAAGVTFIAAIGVILFLPARARDDEVIPAARGGVESAGAGDRAGDGAVDGELVPAAVA